MNALPERTVVPDSPDPIGPPPAAPPGPIAQSVSIGFRSVYIAAALVAAFWLVSNVREITPGTQVVVSRFGRIVRSQQEGLLIAWPRPIEDVHLVPGPEVQLTQYVAALEPPTAKAVALIAAPSGDSSVPPNSEGYLTGDGNVVLLAATLIYHVNDPVAYALQEPHIQAALGRLFRATAVGETASHELNDFIVVPSLQQASSGLRQTSARVKLQQAEQKSIALRAEVRGSLLKSMNARLQALASRGASEGIEIDRIDITPSLPPQDKSAFNAVLLASEAADKNVAQAQTDAERRRQGAVELRARLLASAQALATEEVDNASVAAQPILALEREETPTTRRSLLLRQYRSDVSSILRHVGKVTIVNPNTGARFLLPENQK